MLDLYKLAEMWGDNCPKQLKIIVYVLCHVNENYHFYGSYAKVAKATGTSIGTVTKTMKLMQDADMLIKEGNAIWMLNPEHSQLVTYEELCNSPDDDRSFVTPVL